jgi:hypothetical protein
MVPGSLSLPRSAVSTGSEAVSADSDFSSLDNLSWTGSEAHNLLFVRVPQRRSNRLELSTTKVFWLKQGYNRQRSFMFHSR